MARSWVGISSSIDPLTNLHQPRCECALAQLRLSAITVSYSGMASSYRSWARNTWPLAKWASELRGAAARARSAKPSARPISAAAVSVIKSRARAVSSIANQLCATTECWSSADARSNHATASARLSRDGGFNRAARPRKT